MLPGPVFGSSALRPVVLDIVFAVGLAFGMVVLRLVIALEPWAWLHASIATALMIRWMTALALRGLEPGLVNVAFRTTGLGALLGMLNAPIAYLAAFVVADANPGSVLLLPVVVVMGMPIGAAAGAAFGLFVAWPLWALEEARRRPSDAANDRAMMRVGAWASLTALLLLLPSSVSHPLLEGGGLSSTLTPNPLPVLYMVVVSTSIVGLVLAIVAWRRAAARRRFIAEVARQEHPEWCLADPLPDPQWPRELPSIDLVPDECSVLLHARRWAGQGAYREAEIAWPVAWVPPGWVSCAPTGPRTRPAAAARRR